MKRQILAVYPGLTSLQNAAKQIWDWADTECPAEWHHTGSGLLHPNKSHPTLDSELKVFSEESTLSLFLLQSGIREGHIQGTMRVITWRGQCLSTDYKRRLCIRLLTWMIQLCF